MKVRVFLLFCFGLFVSVSTASAFDTKHWELQLPQCELVVSEPIPSELPIPAVVHQQRLDGERSSDVLDKFANAAYYHHEAYVALYDQSLLWIACRLLDPPKKEQYDGSLSRVALVLTDGTLRFPAVVNTYTTEQGSFQRGSPIISLHPPLGSIRYQDFEVPTGMFGKQWHVFIGYDCVFEREEIDGIRFVSDSDHSERVTQ